MSAKEQKTLNRSHYKMLARYSVLSKNNVCMLHPIKFYIWRITLRPFNMNVNVCFNVNDESHGVYCSMEITFPALV